MKSQNNFKVYILLLVSDDIKLKVFQQSFINYNDGFHIIKCNAKFPHEVLNLQNVKKSED